MARCAKTAIRPKEKVRLLLHKMLFTKYVKDATRRQRRPTNLLVQQGAPSAT
jgi:hypothetical protein